MNASHIFHLANKDKSDISQNLFEDMCRLCKIAGNLYTRILNRLPVAFSHLICEENVWIWHDLGHFSSSIPPSLSLSLSLCRRSLSESLRTNLLQSQVPFSAFSLFNYSYVYITSLVYKGKSSLSLKLLYLSLVISLIYIFHLKNSPNEFADNWSN